MKYKKNLGGFFALLAIAWPAFHLFRNTYTPTQVILAAIFSYIGIRLTYFVYFKNNLLLVNNSLYAHLTQGFLNFMNSKFKRLYFIK